MVTTTSSNNHQWGRRGTGQCWQARGGNTKQQSTKNLVLVMNRMEEENLMSDEFKGLMAVEGRMATAGRGRGDNSNSNKKEERRRGRRRRTRRRHNNQIQTIAVEGSGNASSSNPGRKHLWQGRGDND
jgi:hypothetical protein